MKKGIIILVILLLLGGGGFAGWWFFLKAPDDGVEEVEPQIPSAFLEFEPIMIPLIKEGVVTHHVMVNITVEVAEGDDFINTERWQIRLQNDFMAELYSLYSYRYFTKDGLVSEKITKRLLIAADKVMGKGVIRNIELSIGSITKPSNS